MNNRSECSSGHLGAELGEVVEATLQAAPNRSDALQVAPNRSEALQVAPNRSDALQVAPNRSEAYFVLMSFALMSFALMSLNDCTLLVN